MQRLPQLDGLRGTAILMVFAAHALRVPGLWMGVDLFFVLSGYLITRILLRLKEDRAIEGYWRPFYVRRARRILPPYVGFIIFIALVFGPRWHGVWVWYACFGSNFPLGFGKVPLAAVAPLWSLAVEEQFYFVWPWIVLFCETETLRRVALVVIVIAPLLRAVVTPFFSTYFPIYSLTPFRADALACGAFVACCQFQQSDWAEAKRRLAMSCAVAAGVLLVGLSVMPSFRTSANSVVFNAFGYSLSVVMFGCTLVCALHPGRVIGAILGFRPLRCMGIVSYTFYLYHVAVSSLVEHYVHFRAFNLQAILAFTGTLAVASLSWYGFESHILKPAGKQERVERPALSEALTECS